MYTSMKLEKLINTCESMLIQQHLSSSSKAQLKIVSIDKKGFHFEKILTIF